MWTLLYGLVLFGFLIVIVGGAAVFMPTLARLLLAGFALSA
jgi:hypothetical protein